MEVRDDGLGWASRSRSWRWSRSAAPSSATATVPGRNGPIVFERSGGDGFTQIWTARADLSGERQLTSVAGRDSDQPRWSPDGSRIAFDSDRTDPDLSDGTVINDIFTMKPDGSGLRKLTKSVGLSGAPAYSPDGRLIAFGYYDFADPAKQGIYVIDAVDGSHLRRVTAHAAGLYDDSPSFSPDGRRLVFTRAGTASRSRTARSSGGEGPSTQSGSTGRGSAGSPRGSCAPGRSRAGRPTGASSSSKLRTRSTTGMTPGSSVPTGGPAEPDRVLGGAGQRVRGLRRPRLVARRPRHLARRTPTGPPIPVEVFTDGAGHDPSGGQGDQRFARARRDRPPRGTRADLPLPVTAPHGLRVGP